jgi:CRP-like cAMP-binding protein
LVWGGKSFATAKHGAARVTTGILSDDDFLQLAPISIFAELPLEAVRRLIGGATARVFPRHTLLFSQGDPADRFYVILQGRVKLFVTTEEGDENVVEVFGAGNSFGEAAMFGTGKFPVNAEVVEKARLVSVPAGPLMGELDADKSLAFMMLAVMARRHRRFQKGISDLKVKSPGQRLGSFILSLVETEKDGHQGPIEAQLPFDKALIAARIGIKPESLSRALTRLRDIGVECLGRDVKIADIRRLQAFCEEDEAPPGYG